MQARSMLMPKSSTNVIEISSLLPSQRRMDNLDTAFPFAPPVLWGTIGSLVILSTIGGLIYVYIFNRKQHSFRVKLPRKVICSRCQYFNNNHFIKCAINPVVVLTKQAVDCIDYNPKIETKKIEKWRGVLLAIQKVFV